MTWIAVTDTDFEPPPAPGVPALCAKVTPQTGVLATGSLYLEADLGLDWQGEQTIFLLHERGAVTSHVSVHLAEDGAIVFAQRVGRDARQVVLQADELRPEGTIRLTISWDVSKRWGLLSMETVADGILVQKEFTDPLPWPQDILSRLSSAGRGVVFGPALRCYGISDRLEPVGINPSFSAGTPILTPYGERAVETLRPGDFVQTFDGTARPIRWMGAREVPARGQFRPIRLHAPYFGLRRDVVVAPEQRLVISGPEVEYLFSEESVLVEAHALLNSTFAAIEPAGRTIRYHQVLLDDHEVLSVAGAPMESLYVGALGAAPQVLATTVLRNIPAGRLPTHDRLAHPALRDYEAVTLRAALLGR